MKLATWNVNSIRARKDRVLAWLRDNTPDVLCLQETKVEDDKFPSDEIEGLGYEVHTFGQRTYNGVAILSRFPLSDVQRGFADGEDDDQARFLAATTPDGVRVMSVYVPNGQAVGSEKYAYKLRWMERLRRWLASRIDGGPAALCGDFNVAPADLDVHDPAAWEGQVLCSAGERAAFLEVCQVGLVDLFRSHRPDEQVFTWWDYRMLAFPKNRGLRIDHILATPALAERLRTIYVDRDARKGKQPSDHAPVVATFDPEVN